MNKYILGNHWDKPPEGWISLTESEQDLTKNLQWDDNSIDVIFTEHVQEHLSLIENIHFIKESLRVLKPNGIFRICMPVVDKLIKFKNDDLGKHYSDVQTKNYYPNEDAVLKELGFEGIREEPIMFMLDSLFKGHNHKLLWTSQMFKKVLEKTGFSKVYIVEPGHTHFDHDDCLERVIRGVDAEHLKSEFKLDYYDPESKVIEAKK